MGKWAKPSPGLIDLFREHLPDDPRIEHRRMFGLPCIAVHGNMVGGVFQDQIFLRLPPGTRTALEAVHGPLPFSPTEGRPSKNYMILPDDVVADEGALARLMAMAVGHVAGMPPREKTARKAGAIR
jgi:TfoX/Sxy family transcriptional regulator of competence genes